MYIVFSAYLIMYTINRTNVDHFLMLIFGIGQSIFRCFILIILTLSSLMRLVLEINVNFLVLFQSVEYYLQMNWNRLRWKGIAGVRVRRLPLPKYLNLPDNCYMRQPDVMVCLWCHIYTIIPVLWT